MTRFEELDPKKIKPSELGRRGFDKKAMEEIQASIELMGVIEPVIVRKVGEGEYEMVAGERRRRAAVKAGKKVPALIKEMDDRSALTTLLIENVQREDLPPADKGRICNEIMRRFPEKYPNQKELAKDIGTTRPKISEWIKHSKAPEFIQKHTVIRKPGERRIPKGKLSEIVSRDIIRRIKDEERQVEVARAVIEEDLTKGQAKKVVDRSTREPRRSARRIAKKVKSELPELPFDIQFMQPILEGEKIQTSRPRSPGLNAGDEFHLRFTGRGPRARVTHKERKKLEEFTEEDFEREGISEENLRSFWQERYGKWNPEEEVHVIRFEVID